MASFFGKKLTFVVSAFFLFVAIYPPDSFGNSLKGLRVYDHPGKTRVVLDVTDEPVYKLTTYTNPNRLAIDLDGMGATSGFAGSKKLSTTRVKRYRSANHAKYFRVVLDLSKSVSTESFILNPVHPYGYRLVIDLHSKDDMQQDSQSRSTVNLDEKRDVIIAIDAGHGGEDPGAVGPKIGNARVLEKDIVLRIAKSLDRKLTEVKGYKSILIRNGDYYVPLRERVNIARDARADIFVSIHADAFRNSSVSGASVYTLSREGASSENARWLAEKENRSDLIGGVGEVSLIGKDDMLAHVLLDLSMDANRSASIKLGQQLLGQLKKVATVHKRGLEQAGFAVLKAPDVPSVLIETGYISNPNEARRLNSARYQQKISSALFRGIQLYMEESAPPGTWIAWRRDQVGISYVVVRGDTMSEIALRYGTTVRRIKEVNNFRDDLLRIGQVIHIPSS
tara:strand:- start:1773 stop:3125 length:1353 start_codon:yes stop_codon:yes gene_type:complete